MSQKPIRQSIVGGFCPLLNSVQKCFGAALANAYPLEGSALHKVLLAKSKFGDYQCNNAMGIFKNKALKGDATSPKDVAEKIVASIPAEFSSIFSKVDVSPQGFITVTYSEKFIFEKINEVVAPNGTNMVVDAPDHCVVDFSSPNIAKEMHVGHLRSTIHGESLCRILNYVGHSVDRVNHLGDWGTQFGMLIEHLYDNFPDFATNPPALGDLNVFYKQAKARFDAEEDFKTRARKRVVTLQGGDADTLKGWDMLVKISMIEFEKVYKRLGVTLTTMKGESFYNKMLPSIVQMCDDAGITTMADGAKCIFLEEEGSKKRKNEVPLMIVKSDGGYGYDSTDMAAAYHRLVEQKSNWIIIITDIGQEDHFLKIFRAAEKMGWHQPPATRLDHCGLGLVCGDDGKKFKTRSGDVVKLVDLLDEAVSRAKVELRERYTDDDGNMKLSEEDFHTVASNIGYAAVRYFDMKQVRTGNYKFDYDNMLDPKGNTAVYLLYAYARMCSVIRRTGLAPHCSLEGDFIPEGLVQDVNTVLVSVERFEQGKIEITQDSERALASHILSFPDHIEDILADMSLHHLCDFAYNLASLFNDFYQKCKVVGSDEIVSRVKLVFAAKVAMKRALDLLGFKLMEAL